MPLIMLCGVGLRFNLVRDEFLGGVSDERSPEDRELIVGFQAAEAFSRFHHSDGASAQRHCSEAADFAVPSPAVTGRSPSGSRTARAASILEGRDEILTVNRLGVPARLRRQPAPTQSCVASVAT